MLCSAWRYIVSNQHKRNILLAVPYVDGEKPTEIQVLHAPTETAGLYRDRKEILGAIAALFAQRQIWSAAAVHARFPHVTAPELDMLLSRLAFIFRNGRACCLT